MRTATWILVFFCFAPRVAAQNTLRAIVKDESTAEALAGANVVIDTLQIGGATDRDGMVVVEHIPNGRWAIRFSFIGYASKTLSMTFPRKNPQKIITVALKATAMQSEEVYVSATRTNGIVEDTPVRVEVLGFDEIREETGIKPANISKLLAETSGVIVQQTSATTGNVTLRIQGLRGEYTQLLKDGFPLYGGLSSSLSLLQIPPLDLQQVEVIKGSASALYGGDAIAGLVNLVSRPPTPKPEWTVILNQTHKGGTDISTFFTTTKDKTGITFLASQSSQRPQDVDKDGFTDLPDTRQTTINPKFFYHFNARTDAMLSLSSTFDNRRGGDINALQHGADSLHSFIESSRSRRLTTQLKFEKHFKKGDLLTLKNSINAFQQEASANQANFIGEQLSSYSELSYVLKTRKHDTVLGLNFLTDAFDQGQKASQAFPALDYNHTTLGFFAQDDWQLAPPFRLQSGLRIDRHNKFGTFVLPRFSALLKASGAFSLRFGAGMGYKIPTPFTSHAEKSAYVNVLPISKNLEAETSRGANLDITAQIVMNAIVISINQALYYTRLDHALIPEPDLLSRGILDYTNADGAIEAVGFDTNFKATLDETELWVDYSYTDVRQDYAGAPAHAPLTPRHKLNLVLILEAEESWRAGIEAFYTGKQYIEEDHAWSNDFWMIGLMMQKMFGDFSIIANVENLLDVRQSRYERVVLTTGTHPAFRPIWAPLDGVVANVALEMKIR